MSDTRRWGLFAAIAVVVVLAAGWLLVVKPQKSKVADIQTQTTTQLQQNQLLLTEIESLQAEQKALPQQQQRLQKFSTQVPNDPAEPTLLRQLSTAAHGSGVDLSSISPGAAVAVSGAAASGSQTLGAAAAPAGALYELPIAITVTGSYPNIESMFAALEKLPRAVLNTGFTLAVGAGATTTAPTTATNTLTATLNLQVFYTPTTPTAAAAGTQPQTLAPAATPTTAATTPAPTTTPATTS
jgi:Tfp pilus assembly protein PilO